MEKQKEDLRVELLMNGIEHEMLVETQRAWMQLASSLPANPGDGTIVGGPGFEMKLDSYYDFLEKFAPYVPVNRPEPAAVETPESEDAGRNDLVEEYKRMVASGEI